MKHMIGTEQKYNTPGFAGMVYGSRSESAEIYAVGGYTGVCPEIWAQSVAIERIVRYNPITYL
ncbi:hypothetical protein [Cloacibacillus evryensis]|uniref:Uncharacterized protein n=1 Tax=Cloacibacillus evryensis TaxID=508460 RepID=A0AAW5JZ45_9BACT|nr:hypothetical protein [Cloacibacillus evryensis]MCQ4813641.1 hypothetical protein [Cloacibacillus evryensis]